MVFVMAEYYFYNDGETQGDGSLYNSISDGIFSWYDGYSWDGKIRVCSVARPSPFVFFIVFVVEFAI